jgi:DNA-binding transcriptional MocR family regulator
MLDAPDHQALVQRATETYRQRRDGFRQRLAAAGIDTVSTSGLNVWIPVLDEGAVVAGMERRGWAIRSGADFRIDAPPGVRVTIAGQPEDVLDRAAEALAEVLQARATVRSG